MARDRDGKVAEDASCSVDDHEWCILNTVQANMEHKNPQQAFPHRTVSSSPRSYLFVHTLSCVIWFLVNYVLVQWNFRWSSHFPLMSMDSCERQLSRKAIPSPPGIPWHPMASHGHLSSPNSVQRRSERKRTWTNGDSVSTVSYSHHWSSLANCAYRAAEAPPAVSPHGETCKCGIERRWWVSCEIWWTDGPLRVLPWSTCSKHRCWAMQGSHGLNTRSRRSNGSQ